VRCGGCGSARPWDRWRWHGSTLVLVSGSVRGALAHGTISIDPAAQAFREAIIASRRWLESRFFSSLEEERVIDSGTELRGLIDRSRAVFFSPSVLAANSMFDQEVPPWDVYLLHIK
jgi:hypothetical protein